MDASNQFDDEEGASREVTTNLGGSDVTSCAATDETQGFNTKPFDRIKHPDNMIEAAKGARKLLVAAEGSQQAGDELLYASLFESAPSMHSLFVTPRAVQSMNFVAVLDETVRSTDDPEKLKITVETLASEHLDWDVTISRCVIFRDAIIDLFRGAW